MQKIHTYHLLKDDAEKEKPAGEHTCGVIIPEAHVLPGDRLELCRKCALPTIRERLRAGS